MLSRLQRKRQRILERDNYTCQYCGYRDGVASSGVRRRRLTLDHVIPRARGGTNADANLVTACHCCNNQKAARTVDEWRRGVPKASVLKNPGAHPKKPKTRARLAWEFLTFERVEDAERFMALVRAG